MFKIGQDRNQTQVLPLAGGLLYHSAVCPPFMNASLPVQYQGLDRRPKPQPPHLKTNFGLGHLPTTNQTQPKF